MYNGRLVFILKTTLHNGPSRMKIESLYFLPHSKSLPHQVALPRNLCLLREKRQWFCSRPDKVMKIRFLTVAKGLYLACDKDYHVTHEENLKKKPLVKAAWSICEAWILLNYLCVKQHHTPFALFSPLYHFFHHVSDGTKRNQEWTPQGWELMKRQTLL